MCQNSTSSAGWEHSNQGCHGEAERGDPAEGGEAQREKAKTGDSFAKEVAEVRGELYEQNRQNFNHFNPICEA